MLTTPASDDFADGIVPSLTPPPVVTRKFVAAPWHRPRKQFIRKYQWNHEVIELVIKKRPPLAEPVLKVFGLNGVKLVRNILRFQ